MEALLVIEALVNPMMVVALWKMTAILDKVHITDTKTEFEPLKRKHTKEDKKFAVLDTDEYIKQQEILEAFPSLDDKKNKVSQMVI